jgi:PKD domain
MQRQADGTLADFPTPLIFDAGRVSGIAEDPSGDSLAVANDASSLETYAIEADGSLSPTPVATIPTTLNALSLLVYGPDQPPIAALDASRDGSTAHFDASASEAVNGTIARYDWRFGDGTTLADGGPTPSHTYATPGDYTATVTLTDSAGCSVAETYTGAMSICAGSPAAAATHTVQVTSDPVAPPVTPPATPPTPPTPTAPPADSAAPPAAPEALVVPRSLKGTPTVSGSHVRLAWTPAPGAPPSKRYLIAWSPLHSAQGPGDPLMHHIWTTDTQLLMSGARPGMTLHYAVYAYGSDGVLTKAGKTTIRLPR